MYVERSGTTSGSSVDFAPKTAELLASEASFLLAPSPARAAIAGLLRTRTEPGDDGEKRGIRWGSRGNAKSRPSLAFDPTTNTGLYSAAGCEYFRRAMDPEAGRLDELMRRYALGEDAVFSEFYKLLSSRLYRFCLRLTLRSSEADDIFQEAFMRLHRARATYMAGANALHWAFAIARSAYLDRQRYRKRRPEELGTEHDAAQQDRIQASKSSCPEAETRARAIWSALTAELNRMSEKNRVAYILLREEGLSVKEAAAVLGTTADVVKKRAQRAHEQLRATLSAAGWRETDHDTAWDPVPIRA